MSIYTSNPQATDDDRLKSQDPLKKEMWSSMLDSVASGKRLPERNIFVLGKHTQLLLVPKGTNVT